jgi:leucyl aminopeptidase
MKSSLLLSLCTAALVAGAAHPNEPQVVLQDPQTFVEPDEYLIELSPGETRWVTEEGKWELRRVCSHLTVVPISPELATDSHSKTSTSSTSRTTKP